MKTAAIIIAVQLAWLACAYGAANAAPWIGVAGCLLALGVSWVLSGNRVAVLQLALALGGYGFATESLLAASGLIAYGAPGLAPALAPIWIVTLWMAFAGMIGPAFGWLNDRQIIASIIGAAFSPLSYLAAARFGALQLAEPIYAPLIGLSAIWAIALPGAIALHKRLSKRSFR